MKDRKAHKRKEAERKEARRVEKVRQLTPLTVIGAEARECGECKACCTVLGVHDLPEPKPSYTPCIHLVESGCGCYKDRPRSCHTYWCMYLSGYLTGGEEMRPDKLGVILEMKVDNGGLDVLMIWEVWAGALEEPQVKRLIQLLKEKTRFPLRCQKYGYNLDENGKDVGLEKTLSEQPIFIRRPLFGVRPVS